MGEEYKGVEFEVSATSHAPGKWVGEFTIYAKTPNGGPVTSPWYKPVPGEFTTDGAATDAAREYVKQLIDKGPEGAVQQS